LTRRRRAPIFATLPARRTWLWLAIVVVIGVAAAFALGDVRHLGDRLVGFSWWALVAALGLALGNYLLRFLRWQLYLRDREIAVPLGGSAVVFGAGLSLAMTPGKVGELLKSYLLRELYGTPVTTSAPIVVAERVTDLVALLALALIGVVAYGVESRIIPAAGIALALGLVLLAWPRPTRWLVELVTRPKPLRRLREPLHAMIAQLAELCRPSRLAMATAIAIPAWGCECVGFSLIVNAFPGAHLDLGLAMVIYAVTTIAGALSFLPGGLGVTEGAMTVMLVDAASHVDSATALDATLLTRFATLWFAVVLGLGFLATARARIARLAR
jgi:uncharacterized protein (TIRG00374 family)